MIDEVNKLANQKKSMHNAIEKLQMQVEKCENENVDLTYRLQDALD